MTNDQEIQDWEIERRAKWLAWRYELDPVQVEEALKRTKATPSFKPESIPFVYYDWEPSLEKALFLTRRKSVLRAFREADLDQLQGWLELTESIFDNRDDFDEPVEELCRWDSEKYLLPD